MKTKGYIPISDETRVILASIFSLHDQKAGDINWSLKEEVFYRVKTHFEDYFDKKENN